MAKLVTLESLENANLLCLDNFSYKHKVTPSANGGYRQIANATMESNVWADKRLCFFACNSSGVMGFYMLSARYNGSYEQWQDLKFTLFSDNFRTGQYNADKLRCFYDATTKTFSFWVRNYDWNYTYVKQFFSKSKSSRLNVLTGTQPTYDEIPTSAGTEIECRIVATDYDVQNAIETNVIKASVSDIEDLQGGGIKFLNKIIALLLGKTRKEFTL